MSAEYPASILASTASPPLTLRVARPDNGSGALPTPEVVQASAGVLNLDDFQGDADVRVTSWPLIAEGQTLWLRVHGQRDDGTPETITLRTASPVTRAEASNGIHAAVDRSRLDTWKDDSSLTVELGVDFKGGVDEAEAISFPVLRLRLMNLAKSLTCFETFNDMPLGPFPQLIFGCFSLQSEQGHIVSAPTGMTGRALMIASKGVYIPPYFLIDFLDKNHKPINVEYITFEYSVISSHAIIAYLSHGEGREQVTMLTTDGQVHRCDFRITVRGPWTLWVRGLVDRNFFTIYLDNLGIREWGR